MQLFTERTILTPLSKADFNEILAMYQEPGTAKFIAPLRDKDETFLRSFLEGKIEANSNEVGFWVAREKATNNFIGTGNLNQFSLRDLIHVGCHLSRMYWGEGYGFEVMNRLKNYGIEERKLAVIHGLVEEEHTVSKALMVKMGFALVEQFDAGVTLNVYRFNAPSLEG